MVKHVVVDVDAGTDDAVALLLLLTQERKSQYEIVGITCTHGNTTVDNVCRNVLLVLESLDRTDVPVFRGAERGLISVESQWCVEHFHGENGFGDKILPFPKTRIQSENAVPALNRLAKGGISLICLGPLTNVALALRTYPEFATNVREVFIMGGSVTLTGNASPTAEFNFYLDPEAARIVLSTFTCPITLLPWESCIVDWITVEERFKLDDSVPHMKLLKTVERDIYKEPFWTPCDAFLAAAFLDEKYIKKYKNLHLEVEVLRRGQVAVNPKKSPNVRVIEGMDEAIFRRLMSEMASFTPA